MAASFVDRILKGAKPADLPVEQPAKFKLRVNVKASFEERVGWVSQHTRGVLVRDG